MHPPGEVVGTGADLAPGTLLAAYRHGLFPMPLRPGLMGWWSPDPRGILPLDGLRAGRTLRRSRRRFDVRVDTAFAEVIRACAREDRPGGWIVPEIEAAYLELHRLGWAHSVEAWDAEGRLAGGLYGVAVGGLFAGESMFHRQTDASKAALAGLVEVLAAPDGSAEAAARAGRLVDVQWCTDHLASLGAIAVPRSEYARRLERALTLPAPDGLTRGR
ncbi:MAG TPA: leucyl/phenylalanyl-tRNA--protein transferase [Candidatus Dormibacteraeota bacterium]|nr:leucyl/phenylalanyl-tRNA--protein transferase [Candidatus Dormibacteraeota bacterium]